MSRHAISVLLCLFVLGSLPFSSEGAILALWDFNSAQPDNDPSTGTFQDSSGVNTCVPAGAVTSSIGSVASGATSDPNKADNSQLRLTKFPAVGAADKSAGAQFSISTVGYQNIALQWDQYNSASASRYWRIQYTTDGANWIDQSVLTVAKASAWQLAHTVSFAGIPAVGNNPTFGVRLVAEFESTATGAGADAYAAVTSGSNYSTAGTCWLDMVIVSGDSLPPPEPSSPAISSISDQTVLPDQPLTIQFQVADPGGDPKSLTLAVDCSDPTLFSSLTIGGAGADRTLTLVLQPDKSGSAIITIRATNTAGKTTETSFAVAIPAGNAPPSISPIPDQFTSPNVPVGPIAFTIHDAEQSPAQLTVSVSCSNPALVDASGLVLAGSGSDRTLTVFPRTNETGSATISLIVSDGTASAGVAFVLTVAATNALATWNFNSAVADGDSSTGDLGSGSATGSAVVLGNVTQSFGSVGGGATSDRASEDNSMLHLASFPAQSSENKQSGVEFRASTVGYGAINFDWDQYNSGSASAYWRIQYTTNGTDFIDHSVIVNRSGSKWVKKQTVSFTGIPGVENNRNFAVRLVSEFESTATGLGADGYAPVDPTANYSRAGTLWLDMVTIYGQPSAFQNTAPSISTISDQTTSANAATQPIPFAVWDSETEPDLLKVTAISSKPKLILQTILEGSGTNRTINVVPQLNQTGEALITISVSDQAGALSTTSFKLTIVNSPPTISAIPDQSVPANSSTAGIPFTVSDLESDPASLSISAISSRPELINQIAFTGTGTDRAVTLTPEPDQTGESLIAIQITDPLGASSTATFKVVVENTPPVISPIPDQMILVNMSATALPFTVGDSETAPDNLQVEGSSSRPELINQITFGGAGSSRTVTLVPEPDQTGQTFITIEVTDGSGASAQTAFTVTVTPPEKPASDISLAFAAEAEGLRVSWPADFDGFVLETCRDLASAIWRAVDQVPVRDAGEWFVVIPTLESMGYFRLRK